MVVVGCVKEREIESATAIHSAFFFLLETRKKSHARPARRLPGGRGRPGGDADGGRLGGRGEVRIGMERERADPNARERDTRTIFPTRHNPPPPSSHRAGRAAGHDEGQAAGREHGFAIGAELGAAAGAARVWVALAAAGATTTTAAGGLDGGADTPTPLIPPRAARLAAAVLDLAAAVPLADPQDERLTDALAAVRAKFRAAAAAVGPALWPGEGGGGGGGRGGPGSLDF